MLPRSVIRMMNKTWKYKTCGYIRIKSEEGYGMEMGAQEVKGMGKNYS